MPATTLSSIGYRAGRLGRSTAGAVGAPLVRAFTGAAQTLSIIAGVSFLALFPSTWTRPVRAVFAKQILFTAVDGIWVTMRMGAAVGILLIVQAAMWSETLGSNMQSVLEMIVRVTVRDLAPLIASLVVIGRSGIAMATEIAGMKVNREIEVLESLGIDLTKYIAVPRVLSAAIAVFMLANISLITMFAVGYVIGILMNVIHTQPDDFFYDVARHIHAIDFVFFLPKTLFAGALVGAISCIKGLQVRSAMSEIPLVASRAGVAALTGVFIVAAALTLVIYGRLLVLQIL